VARKDCESASFQFWGWPREVEVAEWWSSEVRGRFTSSSELKGVCGQGGLALSNFGIGWVKGGQEAGWLQSVMRRVREHGTEVDEEEESSRQVKS
jgi:hypothetical protein